MLTYALIVSKKNAREQVYSQIEGLAKEKLDHLERVYGEFDILAEFKMRDETQMKDLLNKIKSLEGVMTLKTCTVIHKTKSQDQTPKLH